MGFRFRLHVKKLPGSPDIVLPKHKKIIMVNGCFWHGHSNCTKAAPPKTNKRYWIEKIETNQKRDLKNIRDLNSMGWEVLIIWQCHLKQMLKLQEILDRFLKSD